MWLPLLVAAALAADPPPPAEPARAPAPAAVSPASAAASAAPAAPTAGLTPRSSGLSPRFFAGVSPPPTGGVVCEDGRCSVAPPLGWTPRDGTFHPTPYRSKGARTATTLGALLLASGSSDAVGAGTDTLSNAIIEAADGVPRPTVSDPTAPAYGSLDYRRWAEMSK